MNENTMNVNEVSSVLGVTPEAIKKHVRKLFPDIIKNGTQILLNDDQVYEIKQRMLPTTEVVGAITQRDKIETIQKAQSYLMEMVQSLQDENKELNLLVKYQLPKVEYFEALCDSKDAIDIGTAAKILNMGIGRNELFEFLRNKNILMSDNQPYQKYVDMGHFRIIESSYIKPDGSKHIGFKTVVFQTGLNYIRTLLKKEK